MPVATTTTNLQKYLQWNRIGTSGSAGPFFNQVMGKIGYQSNSLYGSQMNVYVGNIAGTNTLAIKTDQYITTFFKGSVCQLKGENLSIQGTDTIEPMGGNFFYVTGNAGSTLTQMTGSYLQSGTIIYLYFSAAYTITHTDAANKILLSGGVDYYTTAGEILAFILDVDRWRQIGGRLGNGLIEGAVASNVLTVSGSNTAYVDGSGYPGIYYISTLGWNSGSILSLAIHGGNATFHHNHGSVPANSAALWNVAEGDVNISLKHVVQYMYDATYSLWIQIGDYLGVNI
jgi:hypothetical protein